MKTFLIIYGVIALLHALDFIRYIGSNRWGVAMSRFSIHQEGLSRYLVPLICIPGAILWPLFWVVYIILNICIEFFPKSLISKCYLVGEIEISQYLE